MQLEGPGTATILYTDVVGSTEMRVRLGDVEADILRRRHDDALRSTVARHGGTVVKGLGDGILAAFPAAANAGRAGTDIQRDIERLNRQAREDSRIAVRVGISAGDVAWEDGDCHGTPVVTASRLCDRASGGQILCDDLVRGLARGQTDLRFTLVGELELKGLAEPVLAYELAWTPESSSSTPLPAPLRQQPGELPFAGRAEERELVRAAWKRAQAERATTILLAGEPGIGKTRLAAELARSAHGDGALVVLGRCDELLAAPFAPWTELLRTAVAGLRDDQLADHVDHHHGELARLVPELGRRVSDLPDPASADPETERRLLFEAVVDLLERAAADHPLIVLLDDAHWADAGSVHLFRHVVGHVDPDTHLLLVATYRDTDIDRGHPLSSALGDLYRLPGTERIPLRGLDAAGVRDFLEIAGGQPLTEEGEVLARRLVAETEGNPFFVTEVLRHMVETGLIVQRDGQWVGTQDAGTAGLPEGVRDVVGQRLTRHPEETNDLLRAAAVIGREFSVSLVAAVAGVDELEAGDRLDEAVTARLLEEVEGARGRLIFSHALVRQTLLDELTTNKRVRFHRRIAELLDGRRDTPIEILAHHYLEAAMTGVAARAVACASEAAMAASNRMAWEDAIRLYERTLEVVDLVDPADEPGIRSDILSAMAVALNGLGDAEAAHRRALEAAALARKIGDAARLCEAGIAYQGQLGIWASPGDAMGVDLLREGLAGLGPSAVGVRARTLSQLASSVLLSGDGSLVEADAAVTAAREAGDEQALIESLLTRAWAVRGVLPVADRLAAAKEAAAVANAAGDRFFELGALYVLGNAQLNAGDLELAAETFHTSSEFRGAIEGWPDADFAASFAVAQGRFTDGIAGSELAHSLGVGLGDTNEGIRALQRWSIARYVGDLDEAQRWGERCAATAIGLVIPGGAVTALAMGDLDEARSSLRRWAAELRPLLPPIMKYSAVAWTSELALGLDSLEHIEDFVDYAETFAGELLGADAGFLVAADVARGRFAAVAGDMDRAVGLIESGHAFHERLGLSMLAVESGVDLARVLLRRAGPGDADRAAGLIASIGSLAEQLGMRPAVERLAALT